MLAVLLTAGAEEAPAGHAGFLAGCYRTDPSATRGRMCRGARAGRSSVRPVSLVRMARPRPAGHVTRATAQQPLVAGRAPVAPAGCLCSSARLDGDLEQVAGQPAPHERDDPAGAVVGVHAGRPSPAAAAGRQGGEVELGVRVEPVPADDERRPRVPCNVDHARSRRAATARQASAVHRSRTQVHGLRWLIGERAATRSCSCTATRRRPTCGGTSSDGRAPWPVPGPVPGRHGLGQAAGSGRPSSSTTATTSTPCSTRWERLVLAENVFVETGAAGGGRCCGSTGEDLDALPRPVIANRASRGGRP